MNSQLVERTQPLWDALEEVSAEINSIVNCTCYEIDYDKCYENCKDNEWDGRSYPYRDNLIAERRQIAEELITELTS